MEFLSIIMYYHLCWLPSKNDKKSVYRYTYVLISENIHITFFKIPKKKEFEFIRVSNSIYLRQTTDENSILFDYT